MINSQAFALSSRPDSGVADEYYQWFCAKMSPWFLTCGLGGNSKWKSRLEMSGFLLVKQSFHYSIRRNIAEFYEYINNDLEMFQLKLFTSFNVNSYKNIKNKN